MKQNLLLLKDVSSLGRSGDVVSVKPGYARNYLLPQKKAVIASKQTLRMQTRLKEERAKQAIQDKKDSEALAEKLKGLVLQIEVKVDPDGKMYGSVTSADISKLFAEKEFDIDKKYIQLKKPIKKLGKHEVPLKLKEEVEALVHLQVDPEEKIELEPKKKRAAKSKEATEEGLVEKQEAISEETPASEDATEE